MDIKKSTYYYQKKANMAKMQQEILLKEKIQQIAYEHPYYSYRRIILNPSPALLSSCLCYSKTAPL